MRFCPQNTEGEQDAVIEPPRRKMPVRTVPETAQKKYDEYIPYMHCRSPPAPAQRNIHIIREPARERDVPSPPELPDAVGEIWTIKVHVQTDPEKPGSAQRNIRISGEIRIDLKTEQYACQNSERTAAALCVEQC